MPPLWVPTLFSHDKVMTQAQVLELLGSNMGLPSEALRVGLCKACVPQFPHGFMIASTS